MKKYCRDRFTWAFSLLMLAAAAGAAGDPASAFAKATADKSPRQGEKQVMLFPIVKEGKWGYMDEKGKVAIEPRYDQAFDFSEGRACVVTYPWRGYIDSAGKMMIEPQFTWAGPFQGGLAPVKRNIRFYGRHANYYGATAANAQYADVKNRIKKSCFIDYSGKPKPGVPFSTSGVGEGKVLLCHKKGTEVYGVDGKKRQHDADQVCQFSDGLAAARKGTKWGYLDHAMKWAIEPQFQEADGFFEGLAAVGKSDPPAPAGKGYKAKKKWLKNRKSAWGFIDKGGKFVIEYRFQDCWPFSEGLASVRVGGKWGYIDKKGAIVIEPKYDYAWPFSEGMGRVMLDEKQGFVTPKGDLAVEPQYQPAWEFSRGLARVQIEDAEGFREGYINKKGETIWEPTK